MSALTFGELFPNGVPSTLEHHAKDIQTATVYTVTCKHREGFTAIQYTVLALDPEMAQEMAGIELVADGDSIMEWTIETPRPRLNATVAHKLTIVGLEAAECAELRESTYAERSK